MKRNNQRKAGIFLSLILFASMFLSVLVIPLPIAKAAPAYSWSTFTVAASGDDVEILAKTGFSNYTTDGDNLWVHSNEYTTRAWLRFEGLGAITNAGGIIDQIILSMYSGVDVGEDYEEVPGGYVSVSCPMYNWNFELSEANILAADMNPVASFDGDSLSPSGAWYNKTISNNDPRDWYAWSSNFNDVFTCYVGGFMQYSPDYTYYRGFTSFDEGHPAKIYVKYHTGTGYQNVLDEFGVSSATYNHSWNNYNFWGINLPLSGNMSLIVGDDADAEEFYHTTWQRGTVNGLDYDRVETTSNPVMAIGYADTIAQVGNTTVVLLDQGQIKLYYSHDGGATWGNMDLNNQFTDLAAHSSYTEGSMSVGVNGTVHIIWGTKTPTSPGAKVQVYSNFTIDEDTGNFTFFDGFHEWGFEMTYENIEADRYGRVHIAYSRDTQDAYYTMRFIDGTWLAEDTIFTTDISRYLSVDVADMPGIPYVAITFERLGVSGEHIYQVIRDPAGGLDETILELTEGNFPASAMDMNGNMCWAVWHLTTPAGGYHHIITRGYNFTTLTRPAEQVVSAIEQKHQNPDVGISDDGKAYFIWYTNWYLDFYGRSMWLNGTLIGAQEQVVKMTTLSGGGSIVPIGGILYAETEYVVTAPNGTLITPDPYEDPGDAQDFVEEWDEDYGPVLAISIANIDAGEWVFEGKKRYEFVVEYINVNLTEIQQIGVGFTDETNHFYSVWYDRDANTLTVTSPEDAISGWLHSIEQVGEVHTGINVTAVFHIMFNVPIPDSDSVSAYARIIDTADSGWIDGSDWGGGFIFNIYNLGGLSTLTDSGMAGRVTGGDIFEIYAADTRTPILIPLEDFDVRQNPINWWDWGISEEDLVNDVDWMFLMPRREEGITMYPTNRLPSGAAQSARAYHSYPFGLRLIDNATDLNRVMYMEKNFWREIDASDDELVFAQFHMMSPDVGSPGSPGTGGEIRVMDRSIKEEGSAFMALQLRFDTIGNFTAYNSTAIAWVNFTTVSSLTWYNVTSVFNLTAQTVDVYVENVLKLDDFPFVDSECDSLKTLFVGRANAAVIRNDFYVDDIGAWTDWDKDYGGLSKATMLFKQLQHWGMDMDFFIEDGSVHAQGASGSSVGRMVTAEDYSDHGYWEFGWDIMLNETWVNDFLVARVNVSDGNIGSKNNWIEYNVTWYSQGVYVKEDLLYGLFEGYSIFPGGDKDTSGWHWDIWFNRANASTIVGARINTEYFGMSDKSVWWAVWSSLWKPMRTEVSESTLFVDLLDAEDTIHSAKDVLFVRSWVEVLRTSEAEFAYKIVNIAGLDFLIARDTMSGIDTPPVRETKVPDVVSGFFGSALGSIFSAALKRLGNTLAGFGMGFFSMSIDFMDNIFAALGYPALVSTIFGWMDSLFASVPTLLGYGMTMIGNIFTLINTSAGNTLTQLASIITIWAGMYSTLMDMLNGVLTPGFNLWNDLGVSSFIQVGAIMYPLWLLILASEKGIQAVIDHLTGVLNIGSFFLNFILNVGGFFMSLLTGLIGAIRG